MEDKIFTVIFGLQSANETIAAHETEVFDSRRQSFENVIQIAHKEGEVYRACFIKAVVIQMVFFYESSCPSEISEDQMLKNYGKTIYHAKYDPQVLVTSPPQISASIGYYCRDCPRWVDQPS